MSWKRRAVVVVAVTAVVLAAVAVNRIAASGAEAQPYKLPWSAGLQESVMQGNARLDDSRQCISGCSTHNDDSMRFAVDFALPEGTQVLAARAGTVALANGNWPADHCGGLPGATGTNLASAFIGNETNFVQIDHGDGTSALYLHLSTVASTIERKAKSGDRVEQGELLGLSGKTGYTQCVPHLHFQIETTVRADWFTTSVPVSFSDHDVVARTPDGVPTEGESYVSDNNPLGVAS